MIQAVVAHLHAQRCDDAIKLWQSYQKAHDKCDGCFYEMLTQDMRCATCLDGHLAHAQLRRTYPVFDEDELARAQQELSGCLPDKDTP